MTSFHHQPEAQHLKSSAIHKLGRPITPSFEGIVLQNPLLFDVGLLAVLLIEASWVFAWTLYAGMLQLVAEDDKGAWQFALGSARSR